MNPQQPADGVFVWSLRTPTLPPATTTNTLVIVGAEVAVIEPATPDPALQRLLVDQLEGLRADGHALAALLITHHHIDHTGAVERLRQHFSVPVFSHSLTAARVPFAVDHTLADGDVIELGNGRSLEAVATPGHAPGHLVYRERGSNLAHVGDMVAGEGTILIDPDDGGDMVHYLDSLRRMQTLDLGAMVPAHGPILERPAEVLARYIQHRLTREAKVLAAVNDGPTAIDDVLAVAYHDTPQPLWPLALKSLDAHLRKLQGERVIERDNGRVWRS